MLPNSLEFGTCIMARQKLFFRKVVKTREEYTKLSNAERKKANGGVLHKNFLLHKLKEGKMTRVDVARSLGVTPCAVSMMKKRDTITKYDEALQTGIPLSKRRLRGSKFEELEKPLLDWMKFVGFPTHVMCLTYCFA